jgi:hypothetical protein
LQHTEREHDVHQPHAPQFNAAQPRAHRPRAEFRQRRASKASRRGSRLAGTITAAAGAVKVTCAGAPAGQVFARRRLKLRAMNRQLCGVASPRAARQRATRTSVLVVSAACATLLLPAAARAQTTPAPTAIPAAQSSPGASGGQPADGSATPGAKASGTPDPQTSCPPGEHYVKAYTTRRGHLVPANCKKDEPKG